MNTITIVTLGVTDLPRSVEFFRALGMATTFKPGDGIAFFMTQGTRLALFPAADLARDIDITAAAPHLPPQLGVVTLAHNVRAKEDVEKLLEVARSAGAKIVKPATDTPWGGFSGYFSDLDGHIWEVAWGPMFTFDAVTGALQF